MSFIDCMVSARDQGAISKEEADDLIRRYNDFKRARRGDSVVAKEDLQKHLKDVATRKEKLAMLQEAAVDRVRDNLFSYRNARGQADVLEAATAVLANEERKLGGFASVNGRANALIGWAQGRMEESLHTFRRTFVSGRRHERARLTNVIDEAYGKKTGDQAAAALYQSWRDVKHSLIRMFNENGGDLDINLDYRLPQKHDPRALLRAGEEKWIELISDKLDLEAMTDPLTNLPLTPERLRETLSIAYRRLVTDGWSDRDPTMQQFGKGSLANQRNDARFLIFKDADSWREYQAAFGNPDIFATLMDDIVGMAKDIAAMEILGPNPAATLEWMKQVVRSEAAKQTVGEPSLFRAKSKFAAFSRQGDGSDLLDGMWAMIRGGPKAENLWRADFFSGTRNFLTGTILSSASIVAASTDPYIAFGARLFSGLPMLKHLTTATRNLKGANRREIMRAGVLNSQALAHLSVNARYAGTLNGPEWTRILPDRVMQLTGMTPWTEWQRATTAYDFMSIGADMQSRSFDALPRQFKRTMKGFGIGAEEWAVIQATEAHVPAPGSAGILRPADIAGDGLDRRRFEVAMRYSEAMHSFMEEATPSGNVTTRARLRGNARPGSVAGEVRFSMAMFLTFPVSFLTTTHRAIVREIYDGHPGHAAAFAGVTLLGTTLGGYVALQLQQLRDGKDPKPASPSVMVEAMLKGGGLGVWGDLFLHDVTRMGATPLERATGPVAQLGSDLTKVFAPGLLLDPDERYSRADAARRMAARYTPFFNMWQTRLAYNRLFIDQLQYLTDPRAHRKQRDRARRMEREQGQGFWWAPGDTAPARSPDLENALRPR
jgi:alpha-D-ribose 1-methylphosphonate 5-triphosphate synthase subunit PhnG